ncbi:hypothetical protein Y1Q_0019014 [Alligator mississippiensis]|uniref:Uncharacterized protein n=1 Tax=Alligator mississippiensis TaxID=8496 RepID=A0A151M3J0_ALLMI|nr:hypothetical protein Y1Q_0019014 [Alligator mississippiensis]
MCQLCQRHTQDRTLLLQQLVVVAKEWKEHAQAWWRRTQPARRSERRITQETTQEEVRDWAECKFWAKLLALERECLQVLWAQNNILGWAMETMDDDCQTLSTVLGLVVS